MKRIILYIGILAALLAAPVKPQNIGKMKPVQAVSVYKEKSWLVMETDTEDKGYGGTVQQALQNLKDTSNGILYLDTAEYLILTKDTESAAEQLRRELKENVQLCMAASPLDLKDVSKYLSVHGDLPKLRNWSEGMELPVLSTFGDSLIFLKKDENKA